MIEDWEIVLLEKEWQKSEPRLSDREWLEVFLEARSYLEYKLKSYKREVQRLAPEIRKDLKKIYKSVKDEFTIWFNEEIVRVWKGERLNWLNREIRKWEWVLNPPKKEKGITEEMIERAKQFPIENLIQVKKNFALCPNHNEKHPSFYVKGNYGYCFSCGYTCDTIRLLMDRDNLSFVEAVKRLN